MNFCFTIAALLIAACQLVPSVEPKPGICPVAFNTLLPVPPCDDDTDCPGDEKCCKYGYGSVCAPPYKRSRRAVIKPGRCPKYFESFAPLQPCHKDRDCPGAQKCCVFEYGSGCVPVDLPVVGCPPHGRFGPCIEACFDGCKDGLICCSNGCGHQCMKPVPV